MALTQGVHDVFAGLETRQFVARRERRREPRVLPGAVGEYRQG